MEFAAWVATLKERFGTMQAVADAVGMSLSAFTRGVVRGTLSVENLLELARVAEEADAPAPSGHSTPVYAAKVLHLAGKGRVADLIDHAWGRPSRDALKPSLREIVDDLEATPPEFQDAVRFLTQREVARQRQTSPTTQPRTPAMPRSRKTARHG